MNKLLMITVSIWASFACAAMAASQGAGGSHDVRGTWVGSAKGPIFGAEGIVNVFRQRGEDIYGIVEGSNFLGSARFYVFGKIRGNLIYGEKAGNIFQGLIYQDGTIRGAVRTVDGEMYRVFLRRASPFENVPPYGAW